MKKQSGKQSPERIKQELLAYAMECGALQFGSFKFKSGRISPYFFNMGRLLDGKGLHLLGSLYADAIFGLNVKYRVLYGLPEKGITLAGAAAAALFTRYGMNVKIAYSRKVPKDHGEGGTIVGASLVDEDVLFIDDVVTKGTAAAEGIETMRTYGTDETVVTGMVVGLDRQERGYGLLSAAREIEQKYGFPLGAALTFSDVENFVNANHEDRELTEKLRLYGPSMAAYRAEYAPVPA